jgi:hypothetical protein
MKLNPAALVLGAVALASASPLRVVMISSAMGDPTEAADTVPHPGFIRFGHAVATVKDTGETPAQAGPGRGMRRPCAGRMGGFKAKALEISNAFRQALGLPPIEPHSHEFHALPFIGTPPTFIELKEPHADGTWAGRTKGGDRVHILPAGYPNNPVPAPHRHHRPHHRPRPNDQPPFMTRLHYSLLNLGTWEGRAVAFVLGCGIGVLLRMLWVLSVVTIRSIRGRKDEQSYHYIAVVEVDDEAVPSSPPNYVYPVDKKIMAEEDAKAAPAPANADN